MGWKLISDDLYKRATLNVLRGYISRWRCDLGCFLSRPGAVFTTFLLHIFVLWLSLKQVRLVFRVLTFLRLPEILNLRGIIEPNIYLVLLAMITCFVWLDLAVFKACIAFTRSPIEKLMARKSFKEMGHTSSYELSHLYNGCAYVTALGEISLIPFLTSNSSDHRTM